MKRSRVRIREVGPREGLQVIMEPIPTEAKVDLVQKLVRCGAREINVTSLVNPRTVPQMADADELLDQLGPQHGVTLSVLTPNVRALQRAERHAKAGVVQEVLIIHAVSASLLKANGVGSSVKENEKSVLNLARAAKEYGLATSIFVSAAFGCSIEGEIDPSKVVESAFSLAADSGGTLTRSRVTSLAARSSTTRCAVAIVPDRSDNGATPCRPIAPPCDTRANGQGMASQSGALSAAALEGKRI